MHATTFTFDQFQNVDDFVELLIYLFILFYYLSEIFMITYFGNEIMLSSNRLSYCLFESEWMEQPHKTKKCIIIFGECLLQPHVLLIAKLYPLTVESFTKVCPYCNYWPRVLLGSTNFTLALDFFVFVSLVMQMICCLYEFLVADFDDRLQHVQHFEKH